MLGGVAVHIPDPAVKCAICGEPISLEESKITEDGKPVHEDCYVAKITSKPPPSE